MKSKSKKIPKDKKEKFIELGEKRMASAIRTIRLIGNLSDKNNYIYSDEEAQLMIKILKAEVSKTANKFRNSNESTSKPIFKFSKDA